MDQSYIETFKKTALDFSQKLSQYTNPSPKYQQKALYIISVLEKIADPSPSSYTERCPFSTKEYSGRIIKWCSFGPISNSIINDIFAYSARFTKESILRGNKFTSEDVEILNFYNTIDNDQLEEEELQESIYLQYYFDKILIDTETEKQTQLSDMITQELAKYNLLLEEWERKIETYRTELSKQYLKYNFVALSRAFVHMLSNSNRTLNSQKKFLIWLSISTIAIPTVTASLSLSGIWPKVSEQPLAYLPIIAITLLLIYYFRVILHHYNNTRSQCLQLELRRAICCFAEGYCEFKKDNPNTVNDKLENLIFSSIVLNPDKIPSTFDGLEQITNLLKTCTKNKD